MQTDFWLNSHFWMLWVLHTFLFLHTLHCIVIFHLPCLQSYIYLKTGVISLYFAFSSFSTVPDTLINVIDLTKLLEDIFEFVLIEEQILRKPRGSRYPRWIHSTSMIATEFLFEGNIKIMVPQAALSKMISCLALVCLEYEPGEMGALFAPWVQDRTQTQPPVNPVAFFSCPGPQSSWLLGVWLSQTMVNSWHPNLDLLVLSQQFFFFLLTKLLMLVL